MSSSIDRDSLQDSIDYFDQFMKSRVDRAEVEEELVEEEIYEEIIEDETDGSSSSYFEEEVMEDSLVLPPLRLDTVHENDVNGSEEDSDTDVPWEEVSDSFHYRSSTENNFESSASNHMESSPSPGTPRTNWDAVELAEALKANSDMIERVRDMLKGKEMHSGEGSLMDSSSRCEDSTSYTEDDNGSSSILPFDFDMGNYVEGEPHSSDEEEDVPEDYEEACRAMIETVHPHLDPHTMLHGCDLRNLYKNLKQQYGHVLEKTLETPETDSNTPETMDTEPVLIEDDEPNNFMDTSFTNSESRQEPVSPEPLEKTLVEHSNTANTAHVPNLTPVIQTFFGSEELDTNAPPRVEKWLERDADDPEDFEYACRILCAAMYDPNDPDYDVDTMLRRSTPADLYRYLKPQYWYLKHSNQLDGNGVYVAKESVQEEKLHNGDDIEADALKTSEDHPPSKNVEALRSFFANRVENMDRSETNQEETPEESQTQNVQMHEEKTIDDSDELFATDINKDDEEIESDVHDDQIEAELQSSSVENECAVMESNESIEHVVSDSENDENEMEVQSSMDENESVKTKEPSLPDQDTFDDHNGTCDWSENIENVSQNSQDILDDHDGTCDWSENIENVSQNSQSQKSLNESFVSSSSETDASENIMEDDTDLNEFSGGEPCSCVNGTEKLVETKSDQSSFCGSIGKEDDVMSESHSDIGKEDAGMNESYSDGSSNCFDEKEGQEKLSLRSSPLNDSPERMSAEIETSVHSSGEDDDESESDSDAPSRNCDDAGEPVEETTIQKSLSESPQRSFAEKDSSDHSSGEDIFENEPCDNLDGKEESATENSGHNAKDSTMSPYVQKESSTDNWREDIDVKSLNESTGSLWEQYSGEYNEMLDRKENGEDIDENRLRLLELSVKYIRGQRLSEEEIEEVEDFFDQEGKVEEETEGSTEKSLNNESESEFDQHARTKAQVSPKEVLNSKELEWRKTKIEEDLNSLIKETEVLELRAPLSPGVVAALNAGSKKTALTKRYYEPRKRVYVYYPSVAKALQDFSLIEEAEKGFGNEISFEVSTALCSVAASRTKGNENEVNENDAFIKEATVDVVVKEKMHHDTISSSDSSSASGAKSGLESPAEVLSEKQVRKKRIKNDLELIIKDAEENCLGDKFDDEAIDALVRAANEIVFIKKYYDTDTDIFKYFPSVKSTILNCSLMERAEDFYFDGVQDFPLDYTSALKASAARFRTDFVEVDENDDYVLHMAIDVDIDDKLEEKISEKGPDFSTTTDTASMMSSQTTEVPAPEQKTSNDGNVLEDVDTGEVTEAMSERNGDYKLRDASLDKKASFLMGRYRDERQKIDDALVDLESELVAELKRLDNEAAECNSKHKIEAERIKKDRVGVEEKALHDEKKMKQKTKMLREKLSSTVAVLEFDVKRAMSGMDTVEDESKSWGWFNTNKSKKIADKEKQKQERLTKIKLRKAELEKDVAQIKDELELVNQQGKAKKRSMREWKTELDEEYRHLEDLTSATEAKLKEEMRYLRASYEEEKQRLLNQRNYLEEIRSGDDQWIVSEKEKIEDSYGSSQLSIPRSESQSNGSKIDAGRLKEKISPKETGLIDSDDSNAEREDNSVEREDNSPDRNAPTDQEENMPRDQKEVVAEPNRTENFEDKAMRKTKSEDCFEDDKSIHSNDAENSEDELSEEVNFEIDLGKSTGDSNVPHHLSFLNQPREIKDEASLGSVDIFDLPEAKEVSRLSLSDAARRAKSDADWKAKSDDDTKPKPAEQGNEVVADQKSLQKPRTEPKETMLLDSPVALASTAKKLSSKQFLSSGSKGEEQADFADSEIEIPLKPEHSIDRTPLAPTTPRTPRKSLRDMRRKVEEALERAMAIRNGESSSRHSRSIQLPFESVSDESGPQDTSIRSASISPLSTSRRSVNPMHPMIRETNRLSGFIRRYEKKLETVCKSLLTLASVTRDEKEILAARQYELPEMLEFVVNQDWYKEYSKDTESDPPHFLFSKESVSDSAGDNRYTITATGKSFLEIDGPVPSDISRFLTYLNRIEDGLNRDSMKAQWKEIAQLSGDEQSQRVCDNLDKLISFCVESSMIKK